jgi:hypothetical protein
MAGRKKGTPKTGGRKKGTPNKSTAQIRDLAFKYCPEAILTLVKIMRSKTSPEQARTGAAKELLDRGIGRSTEFVQHSGVDGEPIQVEMNESDAELQRRAAAMLEYIGVHATAPDQS